MSLANREVLVIQFVTNLAAWSAFGVALVWPRLARLDRDRALRWLLAPQMFRVIGMSLLAHGVAADTMSPEFASWVAYGDLATSVLAIAAFVALGRPGTFARGLAALATAVGLADLLHNLALGMRINAAESFAAAWLVPSTLVPMMLVLHAGAIVVLVRWRAVSP
jgi:hypothetical protein